MKEANKLLCEKELIANKPAKICWLYFAKRIENNWIKKAGVNLVGLLQYSTFAIKFEQRLMY